MRETVTLDALLLTHSKDAALLHAPPDDKRGLGVPILKVNATASEHLNTAEDELRAATLDEVLGFRRKGTAYLADLQRENHATTETRIPTGNGEAIQAEVETHILQTTEGRIGLTLIRDISQKLALKEALAEASCAKEAKHNFLANISHELRTPLNGLLGMTQILMGTELTDTQREYLSLSQDAALRLTKVLTNLLSLSHIESGDAETVMSSFELASFLEGFSQPLARQAAKKSLAFTITIDPDIPPRLKGDPPKLRQILANLLFNSIHFTNSGSVSLHVTLSVSETSGGRDIVYTVTDTGIGIDEAIQTSIFDPFYITEDYLTKEYGGAGLGLSISRHLAEIMNGSITVKSEPNKGSTFTLTTPLHAADPMPAHKTTPLSILLAEDEQVNSIMASRLLKEAGHAVTIVGNGQQAIEALCGNHFDLVLMDVQMPVVNGVQATRIIRNGSVENVPRDLPIIGLTAFTRSSEKRQFMQAGMDRIITKPYQADELIHAVAAAVR